MEPLVVALAVLAVGLVVLALLLRHNERRTLSVTGEVRVVDVRLGSGAVVLAAAPDAGLRVERTMRWFGRRPATSEEVREGTLTIRQLQRTMSVGDVSYRVALPPTVRTVRARTGLGQVSVVGVDADVDVETGAGSVRLADLRGALHVATRAGAIDGKRLRAGEVRAESDAGSVALECVSAPYVVEIRTAAGSVDLTLPDNSYQVEASSRTGRVRVEVAQDPGATHRVRAEAGSGAVRVHLS